MPRPLSRRDALARLASCAAAAAVGFRPSRAAAQPSSGDVFERLAKKHGFEADGPGVAVFVGHPPRRGATYCFGLADLASRTPVTPRTTFELASVSKTFTSTAVLILMERKKLALSDDLRKHVPEMPEYDAARPVRIEDLLRHVSGLPDYMSFGDVPSKNKDYAGNDDYVAEFARRKESAPLAFPTGRKHAYNNTNYMLLATVVERVSGRPFGAFLREAIFEPAGMTDTFVYSSPDALPDGAARAAATGYAREGGSWQPTWGLPPGRNERLLTVGDGAIWCSLRDMALWDAALHAGKLISKDSAKLALNPTKTPDGQTHGYGLGWTVSLGDGGALTGYGHDGGWGGFATSYYHEPAGNLTTIVLANGGGAADGDKFWYELHDLVGSGLLSAGPTGPPPAAKPAGPRRAPPRGPAPNRRRPPAR
jgi:CubicO group peptidase (beta-lactamase class C family)